MDERNWCVYIHINKVNQKKYIGITSKQPEKRWGAKGCKYKKGLFKNAINKYGWDNFYHIILCTNKTENEAKEIEKYLIENCNTKYPNGYNLTNGGDGTTGYIMTKMDKQKRSQKCKEIWQDIEYREKIIKQRHDINSVYQSQEFKEKISALVSGPKNPNYGNYWTNEQKQSLSQKQKANNLYKGSNNPNARKIQCIETGEIFDCIEYARQKYGLKSSTSYIIAAKNPNRTAANYHWKYIS